MANLFIVFMPFQLFVAQQIIRHEHLEDCILIEGYRSKRGETHDLMIIESLWKKRISFEEIALFTREDLSFIKGNIATWKNYKWLKRILNTNNVGTIYLGEAQNQGLRFIAKVFNKKNYKIVYFEEGTSHYCFTTTEIDKKIKTRCKIFMMDYLYYLPLFHIKFGIWRYNKKISFSNLPIYRRYSMIPNFFHEPYDVVLPVVPMKSKQMENYLSSTWKECGEDNAVMFMTDPVKEYLGKNWKAIYSKSIQEVFSSLPKDKTVIIKYHHRDSEESKNIIKKTLTDMGLKYKELAAKINIPVEYYLQSYGFEKVYVLNSSTYFYNGIIYPKVDFGFMLPTIYKNALEIGISKENQVSIKKLLNLKKLSNN